MLPKLNLFNNPIQSPDAKKTMRKPWEVWGRGLINNPPQAAFQRQRGAEEL
jgi:hypothetical protein